MIYDNIKVLLFVSSRVIVSDIDHSALQCIILADIQFSFSSYFEFLYRLSKLLKTATALIWTLVIIKYIEIAEENSFLEL